MPKLGKIFWSNSNGERKINCFTVTIPKKVVSETDITDKDELEIYPKENKIVIEKKGK